MTSAAAEFIRDLASLLRMGMSQAEAIRFLQRDDATPGVRRIAAAVGPRVDAGDGLGAAAEGALPAHVRAVVTFGERTS
jgi:type II secretory pathway component PulF